MLVDLFLDGMVYLSAVINRHTVDFPGPLRPVELHNESYLTFIVHSFFKENQLLNHTKIVNFFK